MAFGIKIKSVTTKNSYTLEEFYDAIKDTEFTAGKPEWTKHGLGYVITFPALDMNNQVWILPAGMGKTNTKFNVQKQQAAGMGNMAANAALDKITGGLFGMGQIMGGNSKKCEQLVETTVTELNALGL